MTETIVAREISLGALELTDAYIMISPDSAGVYLKGTAASRAPRQLLVKHVF